LRQHLEHLARRGMSDAPVMNKASNKEVNNQRMAGA